MLSMVPAPHFPASHQELQRRSWRASQWKWSLSNTALFSLFPEYLNSTGLVTLLVNSSCSTLGKPCSPLSLLAIVSKNLSSTEGIYEQQSRINHLPSSTDYIQAFLFLKCNFPIHSFFKYTWSFFRSWMLPAYSSTVPLPPRNKPTLLQHQSLKWRICSWGNILFLL